MAITPYIPPSTLSNLPRGNLLLWSQDWTNAAWFKNFANVTGGQADPLGGSTADALALSSSAQNIYTQQNLAYNGAGQTLTFSVWIKAGTLTGSINLYIEDGAGANGVLVNITPTSTWTRYSVTNTLPANATAGVFNIIDPVNNAGTSGQNLFLWGAQLEVSNLPGTYIKTTTAADPGIWGGAQGLPALPFLPGQTPVVVKSPLWSTQTVRTASGRERRTAYWPYPLWRFELSYEVIRHRPTTAELFTLWEFFNVAQGQFGPWLFVDPSDCQVLSSAPATFATGDGSTKVFQLTRPMNSFTEPVYDVYQPVILDNGSVTASSLTFSPNGVVTFATAPASGHTLSWYGYFYFGCRFLQDDLTLEQIVQTLWSGNSLKFTSLRA
jgi:uncharacterized protein (TIGR02217 family)